MSKKMGRLLALSLVFGLAACAEPYPYPVYATPAPPPLTPYLGPTVATVSAPVTKRVVKRRYVRKRYHRVRCRCAPTY